MKKIMMIAALALVTVLSGCAGKSWETYASANSCEYSGESAMRRQFMNLNQPTSNGAITLSPGPQLEFRPVYKYNCKNGDIWAYNAPSK